MSRWHIPLCAGLTSLLLLSCPVWGAADVGDLYVVVPGADGARVFIDGKDTQQVTPVLLRGLPIGEHLVRAVSGCLQGERTVTLRAGLVERAGLTLSPGSGSVSIDYQPSGSLVSLDGAQIGPSPIRKLPLSCGAHRMRIQNEGYRHFEKDFQVGLGEDASFTGQLLVLEYGSLSILPTPLDAEISLNGNVLGTGPMSLETIETGGP